MSKLERRDRKERESEEFNPYLYLALGLGFVIATILIITTTGVAITGFPFVLAAATLLGIGVNELRGQQRAVAQPVSQERELLAAIRDNGGSITPAEAAMETSLTVRGADEMLSELTGGGHLQLDEPVGDALLLPPREKRERARRLTPGRRLR